MGEAKRGKYLNTKIGIEIEKFKKYKNEYKKKMNKICKKISFFDKDLERYNKVSFFNYFQNNMKIPYKKISNPTLKETKYSSKKVLDISGINSIAKIDKMAMSNFDEEMFLLKKLYSQSYKNMIMLNLNTQTLHPFILHRKGISFSSEKNLITILFNDIKSCSKIGNTVLLLLMNGIKVKIYLVEDSKMAYNYIKTFIAPLLK